MRVRELIYFLLMLILTSCAGYNFNTTSNPLINYNIRTLSVPMFVNRTNIAGLAPLMTKEIILALNDYSGLKIYGGDKEDTDAVLIGVLESEDSIHATFKTGQVLFTDNDAGVKQSVKNRPAFYYPASTNYSFTVYFYLIKRPTETDIKNVLNNQLPIPITAINPKVVLAESLSASGSYSRVVSNSTIGNSGASVNFVKNKGIEHKSLEDVCYQTAVNFKQVVFNAF
jgi:hypothetical protein